MPNKQKDYLSTREAAKLLNVAVSTIQLWTDNGKLSAWTTVGGHRRIAQKSVDQLINQNKTVLNSQTYQQPLSIVVIENNENIQKEYEAFFESWEIKANVYIFKDGYAGLINIGKISPDIIIVDFMISEINGFEVIKAIKENSDLESSLIVVSELTDDEMKTQGKLPSDVLMVKKLQLFNKLEILMRDRVEVNVA